MYINSVRVWISILYLAARWDRANFCRCNIFTCFLLILVLWGHCSFRVSHSDISRLLSGSRNAGAFLCLCCIFLTLLSVLSATLNCASFLLAWCLWSHPSFGYGLTLPAVVCHAVQLFPSQPVLECLVWISDVPSAHTNTFIYVFVQKIYDISGIWEKQPHAFTFQ